ncbi:MAG: hypothetical protein OXT67_11395 [Zetaproteobacteria bacterium]|nr:hypothetical protein [Zetaproteobacteria bacterium]
MKAIFIIAISVFISLQSYATGSISFNGINYPVKQIVKSDFHNLHMEEYETYLPMPRHGNKEVRLLILLNDLEFFLLKGEEIAIIDKMGLSTSIDKNNVYSLDDSEKIPYLATTLMKKAGVQLPAIQQMTIIHPRCSTKSESEYCDNCWSAQGCKLNRCGLTECWWTEGFKCQ